MSESLPAGRNSVVPPPVIVPCRAPPVSTPLSDPVQVQSNKSLISDPEWRRGRRDTAFWKFVAIPSGMFSAVIHLLILIALSICLVTSQFGGEQLALEVIQMDAVPEETQLELPIQIQHSPEPNQVDDPIWKSDVFETTADSPLIDTEQVLAGMNRPMATAPKLFTIGKERGGGTGSGGNTNESIGSRAEKRRSALSYGATAESENAVELALEWIIRHQRRDGSWSFKHSAGPILCERCKCGDPGGYPRAENGATAMGLLPLLGAGNTHMHGKYQKQVARGLRFLIDRQHRSGSFADPDGNMYSHGLATLAVCEALAMTRQYYRSPNSAQFASSQEAGDTQSNYDALFDAPGDSAKEASVKSSQRREVRGDKSIRLAELKSAAQRAIKFIEVAQHSEGGWRYKPGQAGDTSIVGWQMMALKSGQLAGLELSPETVMKAVTFLDSVSEDEIGSCYGYTNGPAAEQVPLSTPVRATTPIGLLCRMYTGWERDHEGINVGVQRLQRWARPDQGMYFYYYATQVMHHHGGKAWQEWDGWMRNYLVEQQSRKTSEIGSWKFNGSHDNAGRLYCTSMAAMTLEIYYRYVPIYSERAVEVTTATDE